MTPAVFAIPGNIELRTGGYIYDRRVLALLPQHRIAVDHLPLPGGYPSPSQDDLATTARLFAKLPRSTVLLVDGLAYGAMPTDVIARAASPIVALVHHPLCLETGLSAERQAALKASETAALAMARSVVVTSRVTARTLAADFAVSGDKITVAEPGTDPAPRAAGSAGGPLQLLSVGAIVPRKACDLLVRALGALHNRDWRLTIAGPTDRSPEALAALQEAIAETGLADRITLAGSVGWDRLARLYASADAFLMASLYEGYGMVLTEAMACGLPIVCTTGGAAAETVPDDAAIKVPPGDVNALATALGRAIGDATLRKQLADVSWAAGQKLPRWEETACIVAGVIRSVAEEVAP